jgi:hypothetical protein
MYDANGRFTFMIMRSDLPKFASNNRAQATAEEGKAVAQGMIAFYGTYTSASWMLQHREHRPRSCDDSVTRPTNDAIQVVTRDAVRDGV